MKQILTLALVVCFGTFSISIMGLTIDHKDTKVENLNEKDISKAKKLYRVWYGHTSHGSQITSGMKAMNEQPFKFSRDVSENVLSYQETGGDLGHNGSLKWAENTRRQLNKDGNDRNFVMWSWCGGCSRNTDKGIMTYLNEMDKLEQEYPNVTFVYMTGHLDGSGKTGNLNRINNIIRDFCKKHNKVLFDFADIESFDPDGKVNYMVLNARDTCDYRANGERRNWAREWIEKNPNHKFDLPGSAAHTHPLNGALKGRAFWTLLAKLAAGDAGKSKSANADYKPPRQATSETPTKSSKKRNKVVGNNIKLTKLAKSEGKPFKKSYAFKTSKDYRDWKVIGSDDSIIPETGSGILSPEGKPALALLRDSVSLKKLSFKGKVEKGNHINWYVNFLWDSSWRPKNGIGGIIRGDGAMLTLNGKVEKIPGSPRIDKKEHNYEVTIDNGLLTWKQDGKTIIEKQLPEDLANGYGQLGIGAWGSNVRFSDVQVEGLKR